VDDWVFPDYKGGSIVNLMSSVRCAYGGEADGYPVLGQLGPQRLQAARNVVLLVIDGLGYHYLCRQHGESVLRRHLQHRITSVAPPTTATAISTFLTGQAPQQHGLTGWFTWFRELGAVLAVLPFTPRHGGEPLDRAGISVENLFGHVPLFDRLRVASYSVCPDWIAHSAFNRAHLGRAELVPYRGLEQCFGGIVRIVRAHNDSKYVYAYWPGFDKLAHEGGVGSTAVHEHFAELDRGFARMLDALAGTETLVIVTADHGIVDVPAERHIRLDAHPGLKACLSLPLCGEQRLSYAYVRHGMQQAFEGYVRRQLSDSVVLYPSTELLSGQLFGLGEPHPELGARIGDYTLAMKRGAVINDRLPGEKPPEMVGFHGGLSAEEMYVPLILVNC
jgi:predicted AlkP superfamily pyrophosphatase or phosphodiesterase